MATSPRDRLSVDLHGLKAALFKQAQALRMSPSSFVRKVLSDAIDASSDQSKSHARQPIQQPARVRLCLRMDHEHARATLEAARLAGVSPGTYVSGLVLGVPVFCSGGSRPDNIARLTASTAELSTLSRSVQRLSALLRDADVEAARSHRLMLDRLDTSVRSHLELAASTLATLQAPRRPAPPMAAGR